MGNWRIIVGEADSDEQRLRSYAWSLMLDQLPADDPIRIAMADYYARAERVLARWG